MIIGIDGIALTVGFPCGTRHYAEQLLAALAQIDKDNFYIIFSPKPVTIPQQKNFSLRLIPKLLPVLKRQVFFPFSVKEEVVDVFHYLHPYGAIFFKHPKIVTTVHDLRLDEIIPKFMHPKYFFQRYYDEVTRRGVFNNTKAFICVSEFVAQELAEFLKKRRNKDTIFVVHEAVDKRFKVINSQNFGHGYFLSMADYSPRKNFKGVLDAFALLPGITRNKHKLKIVVSTSFPKLEIFQKISSLNLRDSVDVLENVTLNKLIKLYNQALCFVFPSFYEGFGLPILEAMATGCPVITSDRGATAEVAGDAAYLVDPRSSSEISLAMQKIATQPTLAAKLQKAGLTRAKRFSWQITAGKTLEVYEQVYQA